METDRDQGRLREIAAPGRACISCQKESSFDCAAAAAAACVLTRTVEA